LPQLLSVEYEYDINETKMPVLSKSNLISRNKSKQHMIGLNGNNVGEII